MYIYPTQAQCNFSSEELHWVSHGVLNAGNVSISPLAHSNIINWLLSSPGLSGGPYWHFTLSSPSIYICPVVNLK